VLDGDQAPPPLKGHSPQFSAHVRFGQTAGWTKMPLGMEVGLGSGDCVRWGPSFSTPKAHPHPIFGPCLLWPKCWMDQDAPWYRDRPWPRRRCVRWVPSSLPRKRAQPQFSAHFHGMSWPNGWMDELMKTTLGTEVDLGSGHIVLDGDPAPPRERGTAASPSFRPMSIVAAIAHSYC